MAFKFLVVFLDNDNTAQRTEAVAFRVISKVLNEHLRGSGHAVDALELQRRYAGLQVPQICENLFTRLCVPKDASTIEFLDQKTIKLMVPAMAKHAEATEGMHEAANILVGQKRRLGLVTSSERLRVLAGLKRTGLNKFFPAMNYKGGNIFTVSDSLPKAGLPPLSKPDRSICDLAVRAMNVRRQYCVAVEDSGHGVRAWVNAGIRVIGYTGADPLSDPEIEAKSAELMAAGAIGVIHHMNHLPGFIRSMEGRINAAYKQLCSNQRRDS